MASARDGLDEAACAAVEAVMVDRLAGMDPARITTVARRVATRVAAHQVAAAQRTNRKDRCVQVSPGPDGTTDWWARLPADRSAPAWAAITELGDRYVRKDHDGAIADHAAENDGDTADSGPDGEDGAGAAAAATSGNGTALAEGQAGVRPATGVGGSELGQHFSLSAALISGCEIPGIGFIDAETVEALLTVVPTEVGRALLDARTGTLVESVSAPSRPPKALTDFVTTRDGTCRMWGCTRPAPRCDVDHAQPWPAGPTSPADRGGLCRRHHRLKQRRRWTYRLARDGTATWTSPSGTTRVTEPDHVALPPPRRSERELVDIGTPPFRPDAPTTAAHRATHRPGRITPTRWCPAACSSRRAPPG